MPSTLPQTYAALARNKRLPQITAFVAAGAYFALTAGCTDTRRAKLETRGPDMSVYPTIGSIERVSPTLDDIIAPGERPQLLAEGFDWSEGPIWISRGAFLLFSDVPANTMYAWADGDTSATVFARPSGLTDETDWTGSGGSNGMTLDEGGFLIVAQHGDRRVARLGNRPEDIRSPDDVQFETLAGAYNGKRFNSPNDVVFGPSGDLYFTDPPYGLGGDESSRKQLPHNGVYRIAADGSVELLDDTLSRPNGIAFSPDGKTMYVSNSDPEYAVWIAYDVAPNGSVANRRLFFDATDRVGSENPGLPDGLKVDSRGWIYATGPGGLLVFSPDASLLGVVSTGTPIANCAFGPGNMLYLTAERYLARIQLAQAPRP